MMKERENKLDNKVSIIVPVYNAEEYIKKCILSILQQDYNNIELILINDGSVDSCLEICSAFAEQDERIKIINQTNQGVSKARNNGLRNATGNFITFVDADDQIEPNMISTAINYLDQYEADVIVYGWQRKYEKKHSIEVVSEKFEVIEPSQIAIKRILESYSACGGGYPWNKMWRRSSIGEMQFFDEELFYFEDLEWVVRMMLQINRVVVCPECLYQYMIHEGSISTDSRRAEAKELSYHKALERIIHNLDIHTNLQQWMKEKYSPEIVNGIVHAKRKHWSKLEQYLKEQLRKRKQLILESSQISLKTKIRCLRLLLFS